VELSSGSFHAAEDKKRVAVSRHEGRCVLAPDALAVAGRPRLRIPLVGSR
jgi:hypothetical protein